MSDQINRNFPGCDEYSEGSFSGIFHEKKRWDDEEYIKLEDALYGQCAVHAGSDLPRELSWRAMRIFSFLMLSLGCHGNPGDLFKLSNVSDEQARLRTERLQLVFEGFFKGKMPDKDILGY